MHSSDFLRRQLTRRGMIKTLAAGSAGALVAGVVAGCDDASHAATPPPATPDEALEALRAGNRRFVDHEPRVRSTDEIERIWTEIAVGQAPFATVLGCADSRLAPEIIFDQFLGDVFVVREAGNIADSPTNLGSLEYAQVVLGSKLLLVLGHTSCGAVRAAFEDAAPGGNIDSIVAAIKPGIAGASDLDDATRRNVVAVQRRIREQSSLLRDAESAGKIRIVGGVYTIRTGEVTFLD
ncbi:MAG: carbonic anhydrase [Thermodesulfobacteriota bacterium]